MGGRAGALVCGGARAGARSDTSLKTSLRAARCVRFLGPIKPRCPGHPLALHGDVSGRCCRPRDASEPVGPHVGSTGLTGALGAGSVRLGARRARRSVRCAWAHLGSPDSTARSVHPTTRMEGIMDSPGPPRSGALMPAARRGKSHASRPSGARRARSKRRRGGRGASWAAGLGGTQEANEARSAQ